jgi:hypothetical protein
MYPIPYTDSIGEALNGANRYVIRFKEEPPVNTFGSLMKRSGRNFPVFRSNASAPSEARLCQPEAGSGPGSPGQAPGTACCVDVGNGGGEAYTGR